MPSREQRERLRAQRLARAPRWAELWQIPSFFLGMACCLGALWFYAAPSTGAQQLLAHYETSLDQTELQDVSSLQPLLQKIQTSGQTGELSKADEHYLHGCILLAEAMKRFPLPTQTQEAYEVYGRARSVFDQFLQQPSVAAYPRLSYRQALAQIGSEQLNTKTLDLLEQTLEVDYVDREKGYQLLTRLRLKLSPPDYPAALRGVDLLLSIIDVKKQWPYRNIKAEILYHMGRWGDIARATAGVPADATEFPAAMQWQALAAFHQKQWGEAARLWSLVAPKELGPRALLYYGQCQLQLKNPPEAQRLWECLWREHLQSPEAVSAQCHLAELALEQKRWHDAVVSMLAILNTHDAARLGGSLLSVEEFKEKVRNVAEQQIQLSRWDDLQQLATAAARWPFGGLPDVWLSMSWHALAEPAPGISSTPAHSAKAYLLAAEHAWKAAQHLSAEEKQAMLLQAGQDALKARAFQQAQRALGELLSLNPDPKLKPIVLIGLAESLQEQKQPMLAAVRLREALDIPGNHEAQARLRLAQLLLLEDKHNQEAGKQLELAAGLVTKPDAGSEARTACHRWAAYLYNSYLENKTSGGMLAINACEKALKNATPHPEAAQTQYLLAELLLAQAQPQTAIIEAHADDQLLRKQAGQLWQACQCFQNAIEEFAKPQTIIYSAQSKDVFIRYARFGLAECWYSLGELKNFAPPPVPSAEVCWQRASEIYQAISSANVNRVDTLHAYLLLSRCQQKRGLFAEMRETLRDAAQQLKEMKDDELLSTSRYQTLKRSVWETILDPERARHD